MSKRWSLPTWLLALLLILPALATAGEELSDPTRPPQALATGRGATAAAEPLPSWELQAILVGEGRRIAVINGRPLAEQGRLGAAMLVRIESDRVLLRYQGKTVELKLPRVEGVRKRNLKLEGKLNQ